MSADDRIEMDEDMAEFWAEVKDRLPGLLGRDGFVSAYPLADPDGLINFIEKYRAGKTDEEWEAGRPVMVTNDGPEPKDVGEHA